MRRDYCVLAKALSPYAQALKHIALRGSAAFGPSAKEREIEMYRKGILPADYRPPVHGKWDDTIERWAYAWQFPAEEEPDDASFALEKDTEAMRLLIDFGQRLERSPPSSVAKSGLHSTTYPRITTTPEEMLFISPSSTSSLEKEIEEFTAEMPNSISVDALSVSTGAPIAYIEDSSERGNASKELCSILESCSLEYTTDGLIVALTALSRGQYDSVARSIFEFVCQIGLGPNAEVYKALMKGPCTRGDVNGSMALIEEMKDKGITPRIGNWHELMRCFHRAKDFPAVCQIVDNMKMYANIEPNEITFALQLRALSKDDSRLSSLAEAIQLFDQMENVYGFIASRPHYDALMFHLSQSPQPEMRLRCVELAQKMDLMGISWNSNTYLNLIRSAQVVGDLPSVEKYLCRMRDDRIPATIQHLSWAVQAHVQFLIRQDYDGMKERNEDTRALLLGHLNTCFSIYELVIKRGWTMQSLFLNALLRLCCQVTILSIEHIPDDTEALGKFEAHATKIWEDTFDEWNQLKDAYSYECYIALLAHQQRIEEAEKLFQVMVLKDDLVPSRRTYECLIFMHLSSGEEGGAARALRYMEAMENAKILIRPSLLKKMVHINNAAGYKRDMKRRARRIMQAREEYMARKAESEMDAEHASKAADKFDADGNTVLQPLPISDSSTLAWWEKWKRDSISKHELFDTEADDGTPRGELFAEKNEALAKMGIDSNFKTKDDVPRLDKQRLLPKIRSEEGEVAGSLWGLDGGELSYPKDGGGPEGWGVRLWRERQIITKEFTKVLDGKAVVPDFSNMGVATRTAGDQVDIEKSGALNPGELSDYRRFPESRYDDGTAKPASEVAAPISHAAEFVWQAEERDSLSPYKTDDEIALEADNTFYAQMQESSRQKVSTAVQVIKEGTEDLVEVRGKGTTRKSKYDYLEKWREMYRHGTLEVPNDPVLRFGRSKDDLNDTMASSVRAWYQRNKRSPATDEELQRWEKERERGLEHRIAKESMKKRRKHK